MRRLVWLSLLVITRLAAADPAPGDAPAPGDSPATQTTAASPPFQASTITPGGFLQPEYRFRQDAPGAPEDTDGFLFHRARFFTLATTPVGAWRLTGYIEAELQPQFRLAYAWASATRALPGNGQITMTVGQMRVPVTRQALLSDTYLSFIDKPQVISISPLSDLGGEIDVQPPHARWVRVRGAAYNGEGPNQHENINQSLLWVGRVEFMPFGDDPMMESTFGGRFLTVGLSIAHNTLTSGNYAEKQDWYGADVSGAWHGFTGSVEYLEMHDRDVGAMANLPDPSHYHGNGWFAQLLYMPPWGLPPFHQSRLEIGARVEEVDRNDSVPIVMIGDPNQSVRELTAVVSYYLRAHALKLQAAASHFTEVENKTASGMNATYPNDQLLIQLTYRLE